MQRRAFLTQGVAAATAMHGAAAKRPNVLLVMMDDFGVGHCAPYAERMKAEDFHPAFPDFLRRRKAGYTPEQALEFSRRAMPNLSRMAANGALFTNAFAPSNLCAPSRSGVLTGCLQNRFGIYQNSDVEAAGLPPGSVLAGQLRKAGYATGFIGKWHAGVRDERLREDVLQQHNLTPQAFNKLSPEERATIESEVRRTGYLGAVVRQHHPLSQGFDYYFGYNRWECPFYDSEHIWENWTYTGRQPRYNTELFTDKALDFIRGARQQGMPFFAEVAYHAVHGPLKPKAPEKYFSKFEGAPYDLSNFYAHVNAVDEALGIFREALGREWENTVVIFCADNGAPVSMSTPLPGNGPFAGHKGSFYQGGIRIPMIVHWPGRIKGGQRRSELVSMVDIMPTAFDAAGVALSGSVDGRSLLPLLSGKTSKVHDHLLWAGIHARAWGFTGETVIGAAERRREESPGAWVVTDGRYFLRYVTTTPAGLFREAPDGTPAHYELYDLREDPGETRNLADQLPQVVHQMRETFLATARKLPPPTRWRRDRWEELVAPK